MSNQEIVETLIDMSNSIGEGTWQEDEAKKEELWNKLSEEDSSWDAAWEV